MAGKNLLLKVLAGATALGALLAPVVGAQEPGITGSSGQVTDPTLLGRIADPLDDSHIPIHPILTPQLYEQAFHPPQLGQCPSVVALAARGSEQNWQIRPARYSGQTAWTSNGFEERTIRTFFGRLERDHLARTGESIMKDVYVLGLTSAEYPAALPLSSGGSTAVEFGQSLSSGRAHVFDAIDHLEAQSGCHPMYLLVGYSQGAMVLDGMEQEFIRRGRFLGSLLIANPELRPDDPTVIGHRPIAGGLASAVTTPRAATANMINYCLPGDLVCDGAPEQLPTAGSSVLAAQLDTGDIRSGRIHLQYFVQEKPWDAEIFVEVAGWISQAPPAG